MLRTLGSSYTWPAVAGGLVGDGELSEVATNHIELDFDRHEALSVVDGDHIADHLGHDDSVSEVGLDGHWLFTWLHIPLGLAALEEEAVVLVLDLSTEATANASTEELHNLLSGHALQLLVGMTAEAVLVELLILLLKRSHSW